jgi:hypothetical protein
MTSPTLIRPARVWLLRGALDRRIALGADLHESPELARRARQLISPRRRTALAAGLRRMVEAAEEPRSPLTSQVPLNREILAERDLFMEIARDLESSDALSPRGIALIDQMLRQGVSPCYWPSRDGELRMALRQARAALHLA